MPLTPKQEAFARRYVETGNASDAYRFAYDTSNMAVETVWDEAHNLTRHPEVSPRIKALQDEKLAEVDVTASDIVRVAWDIARDGEASHGSRVSALALLAKRHHEFSDKHEISSDIRLQAMKAVASMSIEQLQALAASLDTEDITGQTGP